MINSLAKVTEDSVGVTKSNPWGPDTVTETSPVVFVTVVLLASHQMLGTVALSARVW